ncbi:hypothetical protein O7634_07375 [Micromonospora sp. WMMD1120]|nr:hypothetical protein [Micromonospora sp. WMMD1120]MDG4806575.1 hypothetical protein [Micromonospora sp. WMMD1120]
MTQPPSYPMPPVGGPQPTTGGFAPRLQNRFGTAIVVKVAA